MPQFDCEKQYLSIMQKILNEGDLDVNQRTGVAVYTLEEAPTITCDLKSDVPLFYTKHIWWRGVALELAWFIRGETNIRGLGPAGKIWQQWADDNGDLGPVYGKQLRDFTGSDATGIIPRSADQLQYIIDELKRDRTSRGAVVTLWNPCQLQDMALKPCHGVAIQCCVINSRLHLRMFQRSIKERLN